MVSADFRAAAVLSRRRLFFSFVSRREARAAGWFAVIASSCFSRWRRLGSTNLWRGFVVLLPRGLGGRKDESQVPQPLARLGRKPLGVGFVLLLLASVREKNESQAQDRPVVASMEILRWNYGTRPGLGAKRPGRGRGGLPEMNGDERPGSLRSGIWR